MKTFNTTGTCYPEKHYMVNIGKQVEAAATLVRQGKYFCINRGRQYGKTTTLSALAEYLNTQYLVFKLSFEGTSNTAFATLENACSEFLKILKRWSKVNGSSAEIQRVLNNAATLGSNGISSSDFVCVIDEVCSLSDKPVVVMIDEVDQASNNDGFVKFLGVLRNMFLDREVFKTFHSVILAGVYDVKNLKLKLRSDDEHQYNSPWNISVPFTAEMALSAEGIADMLVEYKTDHHLNFDTSAIGQLIYDYTSGYPYLVSRICQIIDEKGYTWDKEGVVKATHIILSERNILFDDIVKKIDQYPELRQTLMEVLYNGAKYTYSPYEKIFQLGVMFSFLKVENGIVKIYCRLMETMLYTLFIAEERQSKIYNKGQADKNQFVHDG